MRLTYLFVVACDGRGGLPVSNGGSFFPVVHRPSIGVAQDLGAPRAHFGSIEDVFVASELTESNRVHPYLKKSKKLNQKQFKKEKKEEWLAAQSNKKHEKEPLIIR